MPSLRGNSSGAPMPGRHQPGPNPRPALRWLAGAAGAGVVSAMLLAFAPTDAGAAADPVKATFSVTGVSTSNCPVSIGGSDVYVKPGQSLLVKSSVVGLTAGGLPVDLSQVASFGGALTIDPGKSSARKLDISDKNQTVRGLATGNHPFTWQVSSVKLLTLISLPLHLSTSAAKAGGELEYSGTIHVTAAAARCGISVQVPGARVSASVTHLPTVRVTLPGVKAPTVPVTGPPLPSLPHLPVGSTSGKATRPAAHPHSAGGNELPVPARVVPHGDGNAAYGNVGGGYLPGVLPATSKNAGGSADLLPVSANGAATPSAADLEQTSTGKHKTIDLAATKANSTGQFSVILAIVAVIALSVVAATYARLYLLRRETPTS